MINGLRFKVSEDELREHLKALATEKRREARECREQWKKAEDRIAREAWERDALRAEKEADRYEFLAGHVAREDHLLTADELCVLGLVKS